MLNEVQSLFTNAWCSVAYASVWGLECPEGRKRVMSVRVTVLLVSAISSRYVCILLSSSKFLMGTFGFLAEDFFDFFFGSEETSNGALDKGGVGMEGEVCCCSDWDWGVFVNLDRGRRPDAKKYLSCGLRHSWRLRTGKPSDIKEEEKNHTLMIT